MGTYRWTHPLPYRCCWQMAHGLGRHSSHFDLWLTSLSACLHHTYRCRLRTCLGQRVVPGTADCSQHCPENMGLSLSNKKNITVTEFNWIPQLWSCKCFKPDVYTWNLQMAKTTHQNLILQVSKAQTWKCLKHAYKPDITNVGVI